MKQEMVKYICDNCGKELISSQFPYEKGWAYLYALNYKLESNQIHEFKDKHFCCPKCLEIFQRAKLELSLKHKEANKNANQIRKNI
jgi:hypothetical protein